MVSQGSCLVRSYSDTMWDEWPDIKILVNLLTRNQLPVIDCRCMAA
jgi:hypothetical protein